MQDLVGDRPAVLAGAHQLRLQRRGQSCGAHQFARVAQILSEGLHEGNVRLEDLLGPAHILRVAVARGVHHQHVFHAQLLIAS
jgi:hypothetical protein